MLLINSILFFRKSERPQKHRTHEMIIKIIERDVSSSKKIIKKNVQFKKSLECFGRKFLIYFSSSGGQNLSFKI